MTKLPAGEYVGRVLRRRRLSGMTLTLTAYPAGAVYPWHVHEHPTLFVALAGRHRDQTRRRAFEQPPLSAVFHPTTGPHTTWVGPGGLVGINLELTDAWLEHCHVRRHGLAGEYRLLDSAAARLLGLRLAAAYEPGPQARADAETAAAELTACLVRGPAAPARAPRWLARAEEFLRARAHTAVRLRDLAAEVGVHPVYCCRAFRRAVGRTVTEYVRLLRVLDAGRQVLGEDRALVDIAVGAGFADQPHFTRSLSRALGLTPGRLRRARQRWFAAPGGLPEDC
jgi:AraC family transcriptional regulator